MKCFKCQFENPAGTNYCGKCGAPLLKEDAAAPTLTLQEPLKDLERGTTIAEKYKILEKLGEGGMAIVYMAEQIKPLRRRVAVKIIKLGMDTKQVIARFEAERQALALMDHPNIAKVYDAGATETGRPYFVMELVHGLPITEYCDKNRLSTKERLKLYTLVCNAVQHAHQKGLIHRDLKPSNILVAIHDEKPVPKIIDFGIAKATEHRLTERTLFTEMGQLIGTPEYMSPEQAEMTGLDIDTRTDIYSLGVLLYELLVGALPFEIKELRQAALDEIRRKIREEEPQKPSKKLSTLGDDSKFTAQNRKTDMRSLARQLRGELDWITMKALEKDRAKRYATASELAFDITRHLNNEPVTARPPSTFYLLRKLAARHRTLLDGIGLLLVMFIGYYLLIWAPGGSVENWKIRSYILEKKISYENRKYAITKSFLLDMLDLYNSNKAIGGKLTIDEILNKGVERIIEESKNLPELQYRLLYDLETIAKRAGLEKRERGIRNFRLMSYSRIIGEKEIEKNPEYKALLSWAKGDLDGAEKFYYEALDLYRKKWGDKHGAVSVSLKSIASILWAKGDYDRAEKFFREALTVERSLYGNDSLNVAYTLYDLASILHEKGDFDEAKKTFDEYLLVPKNYMREKWRGPTQVYNIKRIAEFYEKRGDYNEAERRYREALEFITKGSSDDTLAVLRLRVNLGGLLIKINKYDEAESLLIESYSAMKEKLHLKIGDTQIALENLINLYEAWNKPDKAETYRKLLEEERLK